MSGARRQSLAGFWHDVRTITSPHFRRRVPLAVLAAVAIGLLDVATVALLYPVLRLATTPDDPGSVVTTISGVLGDPGTGPLLAALLALVVIGYAVRAACTIALRWKIIGLTRFEQSGATARMFEAYMTAPYTDHKRRGVALITRNIGLTAQAFTQAILGLVSLLADGISTAILVATMIAAMPVPALATFAYLGVMSAVILSFSRRGPIRLGRRLAELDLESAWFVYQGVGGWRDVRLNGLLPRFVSGVRRVSSEQASTARRSAMYAEVPRLLLDVIFVSGVALMTLLLFRLEGPERAVPLLAVFVAAGTRLMPGILRTIGSVTTIRMGRPALRLTAEAMRELTARASAHAPVETEARAPAREAAPAALRLEGVSFAYSPQRRTLRDISLDIAPGESVALVGHSGSGKTTLVDILSGLIRPDAGRVLADGQDVFADPSAWQRRIAMVPQDPLILDGSLRFNIVLEQVEDETWMQQVLAASRLDRVLPLLPDGLDSELGDRGTLLSGGQRQRVAIARALYRRPDLLLLDEATSALDNETEHDISQALETMRGRTTMVVVAHRLSTVRTCDRLVFLREGAVVGNGTFSALYDRIPDFRRMVDLGRIS